MLPGDLDSEREWLGAAFDNFCSKSKPSVIVVSLQHKMGHQGFQFVFE
jgi:hypothetical protein